jgi:hypothetical protein
VKNSGGGVMKSQLKARTKVKFTITFTFIILKNFGIQSSTQQCAIQKTTGFITA